MRAVAGALFPVGGRDIFDIFIAGRYFAVTNAP